MFRTTDLIAGSALALLICGMAHAQEAQPWYVAGGVTSTFLRDPDSVIRNAPTPGANLFITNGVEDAGFGGQIAVGRRLGPVRLEAEIGRSDTDAETYRVRSPIVVTLPQTGGDTVNRFMANGYYDLPVSRWRLHPYVGVGVGQVDVHVRTTASRPFGPPTAPAKLIDDSLEGFAWQAMGGVALPLSRRLSLTAQYRYLDAGTLNGVGSGAPNQTFRTQIASHNLDVGLRLAF